MISYKTFSEDREEYKHPIQGYVMSDYRSSYASDIRNFFGDYAKKWPTKAGKYYRGLNFSTPESYLRFRRAIRNGYYQSGNISSWSSSRSTAKSFALSPQVFAPTFGIMSSYDPNERVSGFLGIIVEISASAGEGIDVNASGYGLENEVIMPPGNFKITDIIVEQKYKHIVKRLDVDAEINDILDGTKDFNNKLIRKIFELRPDDVEKTTYDRIMDRMAQALTKGINVKLELVKDNGFTHPLDFIRKQELRDEVGGIIAKDGIFNLSINYHAENMWYYIPEEYQKAFARSSAARKVRDAYDAALTKALKPFTRKEIMLVYDNYSGSKSRAVGLLEIISMHPGDNSTWKQIVGSTYQRLNRDMNKLYQAMKDPRDVANLTKVVMGIF